MVDKVALETARLTLDFLGVAEIDEKTKRLISVNLVRTIEVSIELDFGDQILVVFKDARGFLDALVLAGDLKGGL